MKLKIVLCCLFVLIASATASPVYASQAFTSALIRFDRMKAGVSPGNVLVQFTTSSTTSTESKITLQLDSRYIAGTHFSSSASSYTVSTSNLPSGAQAVSISSGQATSVSGNTITFSVSDLSPNTEYAFYITGGFLQNRSADTYLFVLSTATSTGTVIDTQNVFVATVANDQISVSATVPTKASSLSVSIASSNTSSTVAQDTEITYTITYGSTLTSATALTLEADFPYGTLEGSGAEVNVTDYVIGSAQNAYGGTVPVIDLDNRRITWSISSFPAETTNETVSFRLKTSSSYTGTTHISFPVRTRITNPAVTSDQTVSTTYAYVASATPTPTPTSQTPEPSPTTESEPTIDSVSLRELSDSQIQLAVLLSLPGTLKVSYGTSIKSLQNSFTVIDSTIDHTVVIPDLSENTQYFVRIAATVEGKTIQSDLYSFTTAKIIKDVPVVQNDEIIVIHSGNIIAPVTHEDKIPTYILTQNEVIDVAFTIANPEKVKSAIVYFKNQKILGLTVYAAEEPVIGQTKLVQTVPGKFVGKLRLNDFSYNYSVIVRIQDIGKNVREYEVAKVRSIPPLTILGRGGKPVEGATAYVRRYNKSTQLYESIPSYATSIRSFYPADEKGKIPLNLNPGKYEVEIVAAGFQSKKVYIDLSLYSEYPFPVVTLTPLPSYLSWWGQYSIDTLSQASGTFDQFARTLSSSRRLLELLQTLSVVLAVLFSVFSIAFHFKVSVHKIPFLIIYVVRNFFQKQSACQVRGTVSDNDTNYPLSHADVFIVDPKKHHVLAHGKTNIIGEFCLDVDTKQKELQFIAGKRGYTSEMFPTFSLQSSMEAPIHLFLIKGAFSFIGLLRLLLTKLFMGIVSSGTKILLGTSLLLEILHIRTYGMDATILYTIPIGFCLFLFLALHDLRIRRAVNRD